MLSKQYYIKWFFYTCSAPWCMPRCVNLLVDNESFFSGPVLDDPTVAGVVVVALPLAQQDLLGEILGDLRLKF